MKTNNKNFGDLGERVARSYLIENGYEIITTNYQTRDGEIDIICSKDSELVFIEVKTRRNIRGGYPEEAVTLRKQRRLQRTAEAFLQEYNGKETSVRWDVLALIIQGQRVHELVHLHNAHNCSY